MTDLVAACEREAAEAFQKALTDPAVLEWMTRCWQMGLETHSTIPSELRGMLEWGPDLPRGGTGLPGYLGDDYPTGLFEVTRMAWSAAVRGLAFQEGLVPFQAGEGLRLGALADALGRMGPPSLAPTSHEVTLESARLRMRRYEPEGDTGSAGPPIVVVAPFINRWYILDFLPGRSFVGMLLRMGRPVHVLEWRPPENAPDPEMTVEQLCGGPLAEAVAQVRKQERSKKVSLVGYCTGGTMAAMMAARYPGQVAHLVTVCAPVRFSEGGMFANWFRREHLDAEAMAEAYECVPPWIVHLPFWGLRPTIKAQKLTVLARNTSDAGQLERFLASEVWNHDNVGMGRGVFRSWIGKFYQDDALVAGKLVVNRRRVNLEGVRCPSLVISGSYDAIVPSASAEALTELCPAGTARALRVKTSHVGVFTSERHLGRIEEELGPFLGSGQ